AEPSKRVPFADIVEDHKSLALQIRWFLEHHATVNPRNRIARESLFGLTKEISGERALAQPAWADDHPEPSTTRIVTKHGSHRGQVLQSTQVAIRQGRWLCFTAQ